MTLNLKDPNFTLKIRFLMVGLVGFLVNFVVLTACIGAGIHQVPGEVIAAIVALQVTFLLHDNWTYVDKSSPLQLSILRRYSLYIASNSLGSIMTVLLFSVITHFVSIHLVSLGLAAFAAMVWNYVFNKFVIWRHFTKATQGL